MGGGWGENRTLPKTHGIKIPVNLSKMPNLWGCPRCHYWARLFNSSVHSVPSGIIGSGTLSKINHNTVKPRCAPARQLLTPSRSSDKPSASYLTTSNIRAWRVVSFLSFQCFALIPIERWRPFYHFINMLLSPAKTYVNSARAHHTNLCFFQWINNFSSGWIVIAVCLAMRWQWSINSCTPHFALHPITTFTTRNTIVNTITVIVLSHTIYAIMCMNWSQEFFLLYYGLVRHRNTLWILSCDA